jgi:hypothetical protein
MQIMKWCKSSSGITERRHKTRVWGIPLGYVCHLQVQGHQNPLLFSGVFTAEEVHEIGDKESGYKTMVHVQTLLEAFLNLSLRFFFFY